jgi:hypothetical protein
LSKYRRREEHLAKSRLTPPFFIARIPRGMGQKMTVKLALLKSGEDVIADIQEMVVDDKVVGYIFNKPCHVKMQLKEESSKSDSVKIRLVPWILLSKDIKIPVSLDWVITLVEPIDQLSKMYQEDILNNGKDNQNIVISQQPNSDQSD